MLHRTTRLSPTDTTAGALGDACQPGTQASPVDTQGQPTTTDEHVRLMDRVAVARRAAPPAARAMTERSAWHNTSNAK
jgi:hypothetical protein